MPMTSMIFDENVNENLHYRYLLSLPADFIPNTDRTERLPMIVFLHGSGERGTDIEKVKVHGIPKLFSEGENSLCRTKRVITLSPQCPENEIWNTQTGQLKHLIDHIAQKYGADYSRISITGLSMGGYGTWMMGLTYPEYFSAMAPICGGGISWLADKLKNMPIRAFHGAVDNVVAPVNSIEMVDAINKCGGHAELTIYEGVGHDSWVNAYEHSDLIDWLINTKKSSF